METSKNVRVANFFKKEGGLQGVSLKNISLAELLVSQCCVLRTSLTVESGETVIKTDISRNSCDWEYQIFIDIWLIIIYNLPYHYTYNFIST